MRVGATIWSTFAVLLGSALGLLGQAACDPIPDIKLSDCVTACNHELKFCLTDVEVCLLECDLTGFTKTCEALCVAGANDCLTESFDCAAVCIKTLEDEL